MRNAAFMLITALFMTMLWAAPSLAEREESGRVASMNGSRVVIETQGGERLRLEITGRTLIFLEGGIVPTRRLLPGTRVRVVYDDGRANTIFVKAVPK